MASVSIVMAAFRRHKQLDRTLDSIQVQTRKPDQIVIVEDGFDGGLTRDVCNVWKDRGLPVEYYQRCDRPNVGYSNPAIPKNCAIRRATGDVLILQCPEVMYTQPTDIANLVGPVEANDSISIVAPCYALNPDGSLEGLCDSNFQRGNQWSSSTIPIFNDFAQAVWRSRVVDIGGFDESFETWGIEDNCFSERLYLSGVTSRWSTNVVVYHQWHERAANHAEVLPDGMTAKQHYDLAFDKYI